MKRENNWRFRSLESLEKEVWEESTYSSHVAKTCSLLRKKPLNTYQIEDLRIMIGQNIGLKYLIPLALEELEKNILAAGDFYEGDLLKAVLTCNQEFWENDHQLFSDLKKIISENIELLQTMEPEILAEFVKIKTN